MFVQNFSFSHDPVQSLNFNQDDPAVINISDEVHSNLDDYVNKRNCTESLT